MRLVKTIRPFKGNFTLVLSATRRIRFVAAPEQPFWCYAIEEHRKSSRSKYLPISRRHLHVDKARKLFTRLLPLKA